MTKINRAKIDKAIREMTGQTNKMKIKIKNSQININSNRKIRRPGSGRTRGSYSFVRVNWEQLLQVAGEDATILVSRKWCEMVGLNFAHCAKASALKNSRIA